ncbi:hypothetical protein B5X24_HaOG208227 [Helicoverpa armigera]|uniref:Uncharacterized protein n=1 Tax=Helicoverpa armigera TaxID=29058 RepID=A0A2W1BKE1_HELAM|nr:hypothetical protein B5X24_HaOG208227 [Helicoverpa armigera]
MNCILFVVSTIFVSAQCQIFAPYPRTVPAVMPSCPCGKQATLPVMKVPYEVPMTVPAAVPRVAKAPIGCLEPTVTSYGTIAETSLPVGLPVGLPLANPFLPAASPVSALAPFSPLLPPANTCSRCQYLKKIPIPPPCI